MGYKYKFSRLEIFALTHLTLNKGLSDRITAAFDQGLIFGYEEESELMILAPSIQWHIFKFEFKEAFKNRLLKLSPLLLNRSGSSGLHQAG